MKPCVASTWRPANRSSDRATECRAAGDRSLPLPGLWCHAEGRAGDMALPGMRRPARASGRHDRARSLAVDGAPGCGRRPALRALAAGAQARLTGRGDDPDCAQEAASGGRGIYASHLWSPLFLAGTATFAWEAWEQLGRTVPDAVVVPLGGGTLLLGAWRGFAALRDAGLASRAPRLYGVQS